MEQNSAPRWLVGTLVALAVLIFVVPLLFGMGSGMMGWGGMSGGAWGPMHDGWMGGTAGDSTWWWLLVYLWRLLLLAVLVGGGYLLYRAVVDDESDDPALDELRDAYARGDLSTEEFERRRERLEE